jgi:hypothetical protein
MKCLLAGANSVTVFPHAVFSYASGKLHSIDIMPAARFESSIVPKTSAGNT